MLIDFIIPVTYVPEDNESYINTDVVLMKDCSQVGDPNPECDGYNFNRCPNDSAYCQPFLKGDVVKLQYIVNVKKYKKIFVDVINTATGEVEYSVAVTTQQGSDSTRTNYLNVIIDTNQAIFDSLTCWYVKISLYGCLLTDQATAEDYATCLREKQFDGLTLAEAQRECYSEMCEISDFIASEPYCAVRCDEPTLLVQGSYPEYDCNGNYYGLFVGSLANSYTPTLRIRGVVEPNGYSFQETVNHLKRIKSQQSEQFLFRVKMSPYYVAQQIAVCFNSAELTIDGLTYTKATKLDKNFDEGSEWIIQEAIFRECSEINFTCQ